MILDVLKSKMSNSSAPKIQYCPFPGGGQVVTLGGQRSALVSADQVRSATATPLAAHTQHQQMQHVQHVLQQAHQQQLVPGKKN